MNSLLTVESGAALDDDAVVVGEVDLVEEMRLRTWARRNYVTRCEREPSWHPVICDEMARMDDEALSA